MGQGVATPCLASRYAGWKPTLRGPTAYLGIPSQALRHWSLPLSPVNRRRRRSGARNDEQNLPAPGHTFSHKRQSARATGPPYPATGTQSGTKRMSNSAWPEAGIVSESGASVRTDKTSWPGDGTYTWMRTETCSG